MKCMKFSKNVCLGVAVYPEDRWTADGHDDAVSRLLQLFFECA